MGDHPQYSICSFGNRGLCIIFSEERSGQDNPVFLAVYPIVISFLYSGRSGGGTGSHAGDAHAPQDRMLHPYDHSLPAFGQKAQECGRINYMLFFRSFSVVKNERGNKEWTN